MKKKICLFCKFTFQKTTVDKHHSRINDIELDSKPLIVLMAGNGVVSVKSLFSELIPSLAARIFFAVH